MSSENIKQQIYSFLGLVLLTTITSFAVLSFYPDSFTLLPVIIFSLCWSIALIYFYNKNHIALALNSFAIFWLFIIAEKISYGSIGLKSLLSYFLFIAVGVSFAFLLTYQEIGKKSKNIASFLVISGSLVLYFLPLVHIIYYLSFQKIISPDVRYAIAHTNLGEAVDFIKVFIEAKWILLSLFILICSSYFLYRKEKNDWGLVNPLLAVFLILGSLSQAYINRHSFRVIFDWKVELQKYAFEISQFKDQQKKVNSGQIKFLAEKENNGEVYVVIIGESLNKNHMQLYGYGRDTTPSLSRLLDNREVISFKNAYSNHTHSMPVLSHALTEANQQIQKPFEESLSIIDISKKAGFETHWISNQALYGLWDNLVTIIAKNAGSVIALNRGIGASINPGFHDEEALKYVQKILRSGGNKNKVLFVHLFGSHWEYCSRYPDEYKKYEGSLGVDIFGELARETKNQSYINCYDNSVLYNDFIVSSIIDIAKRQDGVSGVVYFSDHGEEVINVRGHDAEKFAFSMTQIPLLFWFSEEYKSKYKNKITHLNQNVEKLFPNDLVYDSLIGTLGIKTQHYTAAYDISSSMYEASSIKHLTLHGKQDYLASENISYWQKNNSAELKSINQDSRVIPHRVNTVGKLKDILNNGFHAFEIDLIFREEAGGYFDVGHDGNTLSGLSFEKFLSHVPHHDKLKIWLDIKNLNGDNIKSALGRLIKLDNIFKLKGRVIIESKITDSSFAEVSEEGFHTSYSLPQSLILELENVDESGRIKIASSISNQIIGQKTEAISFDIRLYEYVKNYIEMNIKSSVSYHIWNLSAPISDRSFIENLKKKECFYDERVRTILVPYESLFNL
jgi:heptose-I-phosphate ethanolaminephosphotransferase